MSRSVCGVFSEPVTSRYSVCLIFLYSDLLVFFPSSCPGLPPLLPRKRSHWFRACWRRQSMQPAPGPTRCRRARCPLLARLLPMPMIGVPGSMKRAREPPPENPLTPSSTTMLVTQPSHTANVTSPVPDADFTSCGGTCSSSSRSSRIASSRSSPPPTPSTRCTSRSTSCTSPSAS